MPKNLRFSIFGCKFGCKIKLEVMKKKRIVVSTGAGVSAESGMSTYRDAGGLWDNYPVMQVASYDGFVADPELIHKFYSTLREKLISLQPNDAHRLLAEMEQDFDMQIITQNVDDLHERAGSTNVLHLHGELMKVRSMRVPGRVYALPNSELVTPDSDNPLTTTINTRDSFGDPVRPHIVFFQEDVPNISPAIDLVKTADVFVVIGTSLVVYPAAGLLNYVPKNVPVYYIDPRPAAVPWREVNVIEDVATKGVAHLREILKNA